MDNAYKSFKETQTVGDLVLELQKLDLNIPVRLLCDHVASSAQLKGEQMINHSIHLEIDFDYLTPLLRTKHSKEVNNNGSKIN